MPPQTLVLIGDSILDNAPYTNPLPDTAQHLRELMAPAWSVERLAEDGAIMSSVKGQLVRLGEMPAAAVLSIGGNDATAHIDLLDRATSNSGDVLDELMTITDDFGRRYGKVAKAVADRAGRTILCTIYEARLEPSRYARLARAPLALLNDQIIRTGAALGLDILELRSVCTEADDFVLQIEPSPQGARKIAEAIAAVLNGAGEHFNSGRLFSA